MAERLVRVGDNLYRKGDTYHAGAVPRGQRRLRFKSLGVTQKGRAKELLPAAVDEIRAGPTRVPADLSTTDGLFDAFLAHKKRTVSARTFSDSPVRPSRSTCGRGSATTAPTCATSRPRS